MGKFSNEKKIKNEGPDQLNRLVQGAVIEGNITTSTSLRLDGTVKGNLKCEGKLVLGAEGRVEGEIHSVNAEIEGKIIGDLYVSELLYLKNTSVIEGNIVTPKIIIENGAAFNGNCTMSKNQSFTSNEEIAAEKTQIETPTDSDVVY